MSPTITTIGREVRASLDRDHLFASPEWIQACVDWCQAQGIRDPPAVIQACRDQWLATDIRAEGVQSVPVAARLPVASHPPVLKSELPADGRYTLQVLEAVDVGLGAYAQLLKDQKVQDENSRVSAEAAEASFVAAWAPKAARMLRLVLHDGQDRVEAIEHQRLSQLPDRVPPGLKLSLRGPVVVRRGLLYLTPANVRVLGGHVEELEPEAGHGWRTAVTRRLEPSSGPERPPGPATGVFRSRGLPIRFRGGGTGFKSELSLHQRPTQPYQDPFEDDEADDFLASVEIPECAGGELFDDDGDDFLAGLDMGQVGQAAPPPGASSARVARGRGRPRGSGPAKRRRSQL